ncbi:unnamed protein product [Lymnaea stagnalis]|uniref:C2H2-type domain-containing protein n=1 Tax=Lymnaea stagnalis TaxID=6523 RepID=A0AAV2IHW1_LYMST
MIYKYHHSGILNDYIKMTQKATSSNVSWQDLGIITCSLCNLKTSDQALFQAHNCKPRKSMETLPLTKAKISYSSITKKFYCSICSIEINEKHIEDHIENHINLKPYICHYCSLPFGSQLKVFQHCSSHHTTADPLYLLRVSRKTKDLIRKVKLKGSEFYVPLNFNVVPVKKSVLLSNNEIKEATWGNNVVSKSVNHSENSQNVTLNPALPSGFRHSENLNLATKSKILAPKSVTTTSAEKAIIHKSFPVANLSSAGAMEKSSNFPLVIRQNMHLITCVDKKKQTLNNEGRFCYPNEGSAECPVVSMKLPIQLISAAEKETTLIKDNRNLDVNNEIATSWEIIGNHSRNELNTEPNLPIDNFCGHSSFSDNVSQATFVNGHDYLRVVKGYFLCLKCKMKWSSDYDSFFKHIWTYHVHGEDFSCCPDGYSVKCLQLKTVLKSVYDKSQETMSDIIKSYLQFDSAIKEIDSVNNADSNTNASNSVTNCSVSTSPPTVACSVSVSFATVAHSVLPSPTTVASNSDNTFEEINKNKRSNLLQDASDFTQQSLRNENTSHSNQQLLYAPDSYFHKGLYSLNRAERYSTESSEAGGELGDEGLKSFYQCGQLNCTYASVQPVDLLLHSEQSHGAEDRFPCIYCGFPASSISILLDHMNQHIGNDNGYVFSCSILDSSHVIDRFESQDLKHVLGKFEEMLKLNDKSNLCFVCNTCETQFKSLGKLKEHLQNFLLKVIRCKHCRSFFLDTSSWQKHRAKEHPNEPRLYCINRKLLCDARKKNFSEFVLLTEKRKLCHEFCIPNTNRVLVSNDNMLEAIDSLAKDKFDQEKELSQPGFTEISPLHETTSPLISETSSCDLDNSTNNSQRIDSLVFGFQLENYGVTQTSNRTCIEMEVIDHSSIVLNNSENLDNSTTLNNEHFTSEANKQFVSEERYCLTEDNTLAKNHEKQLQIERGHEALTEVIDPNHVLNPRINSKVSETLTEIITVEKNNSSKGVHDCDQIICLAIGDAEQSESDALEISDQQAHPEIISEISKGLEITKACITFESSSNMGEGNVHFCGSKDMDCKSCSDLADCYDKVPEIPVEAANSTSTDLCAPRVSNETKAKSLLNESFTQEKSQEELNHIDEYNTQNKEINSLDLIENDIQCTVSPVLESTDKFINNNAIEKNEENVSLSETRNQKEWNTMLTPAENHKACKRLLNSKSNKEVPPVKKVKKSNSLPNNPHTTEVISLDVISDEYLNVNISSIENKTSEERKTTHFKTGLKAGIKRKTVLKYSCIHDGCSFVSRWHKPSMCNHVRNKHPYCSCGYCGAIYFFRNHLINHLRFAHRGMEPNINDDVPLEKLFEVIEPQEEKIGSNDKYGKDPVNINDFDNVNGEIKNKEANTIIEKYIEHSIDFYEKDLKIPKNSNYTNLKYVADNEKHSAGPNNHSKNKKSQPLSCADMSLKDSSSEKNLKKSSLESSDTLIKQRKRKIADEKLSHISATKKNKPSKHTYKSSNKPCKTSKTSIELLGTKQISCEHSLDVIAGSKDSPKTSGKMIDMLSETLPQVYARVKNYQTSPVCRKKNVIQTFKNNHLVDKSETPKEIMSIEDYPFQCDVCKSCIKSLNDVEEHFKVLHSGENETFFDRETSSTYAITGELLNSKSGVKSNPTNLCTYCSFRKETRSDVEEHIRHVHPQNDVNVFLLGVTSLPQATSIRESHTNSTTDNLSTTSKVVKGTSPSSLVYNCNKCGDQLGSEFLFRFHLAQHGGFKHTNVLTTTGLLVCPICGYFASSHHDLGQHTGTHLNERRYKCSLCDFDGHNKPSINYHLSTAHCGVEGIEIIDRNKRSKMHLQPTLVNMQPQVQLKNALHYADYLSELLIKNDIKNIELTSDICAHIFKHNSDQYFDVVPIDESE